MQEILLAIHVKRGTWDKSKPVGPWITSIVSYKLSGMLRARRVRSLFDLTLEGLATVLWETRSEAGGFVEYATSPTGNVS